jgi:hypothetical protein
MVFESECSYGVGVFEVRLLKISSLKLSHLPVCSGFQDLSYFSMLRYSLMIGRNR